MSTNKRMGDAHESFLASLFEGIQTRGSGNQWANPIDGRQSRMHKRFAFAWDGKSTLGKSLSIPLAMWNKAREQAGGERPMLGLRWYANEKLDVVRDLVVVDAHDFHEVLEVANKNPYAGATMEISIVDKEEPDHMRVIPSPDIFINGVWVGLDQIGQIEMTRTMAGSIIKVNGKRVLLPTTVSRNGEVVVTDQGLLAELTR